MLCKHEVVLAILLITSLVSACSHEAKGIPVKQFRDPPEVALAKQQKQEQMEAEIAKLSQVRENQVFTERNGQPEYIVGPGDVLLINFWEGSRVTPYDATVRPDGRISYSFLDNVQVSGHTPTEIRNILIEALRRYIRQPRIEVMLRDYRSKTVLLFGQINALQGSATGPGKYPLKGKTTVLDLIVSAGGPISGRGGALVGRQIYVGGQDAGNADLRKVELLRRGKQYTLNLYNAMFRGDLSQNVVLDEGDIITVPELPLFGERVYVFGEVAIQGVYRLKDAPDLLGSISASGGVTRVAVKDDIKIIREYEQRKGHPIILSANLDQILKQGDLSQNIELRDGDVVYVPRTTIGDLNEFVVNMVPLLEFTFYPARYRDAYSDTTKLRFY